MAFKKNNPGCCDCQEVPCQDQCFIPCTGATDQGDCIICEIDIQLPAPNIVGRDPLLLPPEECPEEAPCWACYQFFDQRLTFSGGFAEYRCNDWLISSVGLTASGSTGSFAAIVRNQIYQLFLACWNAINYSCPYDSNVGPCPSSNVAITGLAAFAQFDGFNTGHLFELSGNEWDGSCGKLTFKIGYTVFEYSPSYDTDPITDPGNCNDYKWTAYLHTFELNYCTCDDVLEPFTFVSTQSVDSCAGGVEDPCHVDEATITLKRLNNGENCKPCHCVNCVGYKNSELMLEVTGPLVNGTFVLPVSLGNPNGTTNCIYELGIGYHGDCEQSIFLRVVLNCLACDQFRAGLIVYTERIGGGFFESVLGTIDAIDCGDTKEFTDLEYPTTPPTPECDLAGHTFQLSFVPA